MGKKVDKNKVLELWDSDMRNDELAEALGVSRGSLSRLRARYSLPIRSSRVDRTAKGDPTPEEIEQRSAIVRAGWSKQVAAARWQRGERVSRGRAYVYDGRNASFSPMDT